MFILFLRPFDLVLWYASFRATELTRFPFVVVYGRTQISVVCFEDLSTSQIISQAQNPSLFKCDSSVSCCVFAVFCWSQKFVSFPQTIVIHRVICIVIRMFVLIQTFNQKLLKIERDNTKQVQRRVHMSQQILI